MHAKISAHEALVNRVQLIVVVLFGLLTFPSVCKGRDEASDVPTPCR